MDQEEARSAMLIKADVLLSGLFVLVDNAWLVWEFDAAPQVLQAISDCGGDEDYILALLIGLKDRWIPWAEEVFGCGTVKNILLHSGISVRVGCHA